MFIFDTLFPCIFCIDILNFCRHFNSVIFMSVNLNPNVDSRLSNATSNHFCHKLEVSGRFYGLTLKYETLLLENCCESEWNNFLFSWFLSIFFILIFKHLFSPAIAQMQLPCIWVTLILLILLICLASRQMFGLFLDLSMSVWFVLFHRCESTSLVITC